MRVLFHVWTYIAETLTKWVFFVYWEKRFEKLCSRSFSLSLSWLSTAIQYACQWYSIVTLFSLFLDGDEEARLQRTNITRAECVQQKRDLTPTYMLYYAFSHAYTLFGALSLSRSAHSFGTSFHRRCVEQQQYCFWLCVCLFRVHHGIIHSFDTAECVLW